MVTSRPSFHGNGTITRSHLKVLSTSGSGFTSPQKLSLRPIASLLVPVPHRHAPVVVEVVREATAGLAETARTTVGEMTVARRMAHQASSVHNSPVLVVVVLENRSAMTMGGRVSIFSITITVIHCFSCAPIVNVPVFLQNSLLWPQEET